MKTTIENLMYEKISKYYNLQMDSIGPEEYTFIQKTIGYPETYSEHMQSLKDALRPKEETIQHIKEFITKYPEFRKEQYLAILDYINQIIETDPVKAKQAGMEALLKAQEELDSDSESTMTSSQADIPEFIEFPIGNQNIKLPSYQDPLLISLYSVCMVAFDTKINAFQNTGTCREQTRF